MAKASSDAAVGGAAVAPGAAVGATRGGQPSFLERLKQPSAQPIVDEVRDFVGQFPADLTRPQAARRIHAFLSDVTPRLLLTSAFADDPPEDAFETAMEGLEKFVVLKLQKLLFRHAPADLREDEHAEQCLRSAAQSGVEEWHVDSPEHSQAVGELQRVNQYRAPKDKTVCMVNAYRIAEGILLAEAYRRGGAAGDDAAALRALLRALLVKASLANVFSNIVFTAAFRHPARTSAEERKCLRELALALSELTGASVAQSVLEAQGGMASEARPPWLVDAGIDFRFEGREDAGELEIGEVDELLDEYRRIARALRELSGVSAS